MIWLSLALALVISWLFYRRTVPALNPARRWLLFSLRAATLWVVLLLLLNPVIRRQSTLHARPEVWLMQDVSQSMRQPVHGGTKADLFSQALSDTLDELRRQGYEPVVVPFAGGLATGGQSLESTRLSPALQATVEARGADHLRRVMLFTDGWLKDATPEEALALGVPIDAWMPAWHDSTFDLSMQRVHAPDEVFAGEQIPLAIDVAAQGYAGQARVTVLVDGKSVATQPVDFATGAHQQLQLDTTLDAPGLHTIEARIATAEDGPTEPDTGNNRLPVAVQVQSSHPTALILCDQPDWELNLLRQGAQRLPGWQASVWQAEGTRWKRGEQSQNLASLVDDSTRLLMLVNHGQLQLSADDATRIERFVTNGGGLLLLGAHLPALQELLPGEPSNIRQWFEGSMLLSAGAKRYETFRRIAGREGEMPPVDYRYVTAKAGAEVLASAANPEDSPLALSWQRGQGRVLWLAMLGLWRWQLWGEDDTALGFVGDIASWLGHPAAQRFTAFSDRAGYRLGESVTLRLHAFDERMNRQRDLQPLAVVSDSTGATRAQGYLAANDEGVYALQLPDLPAGRYRYTIRDDRTAQSADGSFAIASVGSEQQDRGLNTSLPAWLAQRSGGTLYTSQQTTLPAVQPIAIPRRSELALYKKWYVIALFLAAFGVELFLRKRWGLL